MTAIIGRMATYSGKVVTWDDAFNSQLSLARAIRLGRSHPRLPDAEGRYPVAIPGVTQAF